MFALPVCFIFSLKKVLDDLKTSMLHKGGHYLLATLYLSGWSQKDSTLYRGPTIQDHIPDHAMVKILNLKHHKSSHTKEALEH